jgi:predicted RNA-binding protein with TRAM domain
MMFDRRRGGRGGGMSFGRGRGFRDDRDDLPKPVKVGEEYDVEIKEVGSKGDGIARIKNFVVFVNGAKMGEKIKVKIVDVRGRFATAEKAGAASEKAVSETESEEAEQADTEETVDSEEAEVAEAEEEAEAENTEPVDEFVEEEVETEESEESEE